eukprot:3232677-Pleurochrysis_carterae.AAC.1
MPSRAPFRTPDAYTMRTHAYTRAHARACARSHAHARASARSRAHSSARSRTRPSCSHHRAPSLRARLRTRPRAFARTHEGAQKAPPSHALTRAAASVPPR